MATWQLWQWLVLWLLTSVLLNVMFSSFYRHNEWNLFFALCSLSWMHWLAVKAILSAWGGWCVAMAKSRSNVINKSQRDHGIFLLFACTALRKMFVYSFQQFFFLATNLQNLLAHLSSAPQRQSSPTQLLLRSPSSSATQYLPGSLRGRPEAAARLAALSAHSRSAEGGKFGPWKKSEKDAEGCCVCSLRRRVCTKTKPVETLEGEAAEMKTNTRQNNEKRASVH